MWTAGDAGTHRVAENAGRADRTLERAWRSTASQRPGVHRGGVQCTQEPLLYSSRRSAMQSAPGCTRSRASALTTTTYVLEGSDHTEAHQRHFDWVRLRRLRLRYSTRIFTCTSSAARLCRSTLRALKRVVLRSDMQSDQVHGRLAARPRMHRAPLYTRLYTALTALTAVYYGLYFSTCLRYIDKTRNTHSRSPIPRRSCSLAVPPKRSGPGKTLGAGLPQSPTHRDVAGQSLRIATQLCP